MSSERRVGRTANTELLADAGMQTLISFTSMQSPLVELPPEAYRNLLVISTKSPEHVEQRLVEMGVAISNVGLIPLAGESYDYDGPLWTTDVVKPNDPTGVSIAFTESLAHLISELGYVLVEDLNVLTMYLEEETVCRLLSHLATEARNRDVCGLYGVVRSAVSDDTYRNFRKAVDRDVDLRN